MEERTPLHLGVVAIEKGAFGSPSTKVANFTYYCYVALAIHLNIIHWFAHSEIVKQFYFTHREDPNKHYHTGPEWTWE